jgi:hypothetical protein
MIVLRALVWFLLLPLAQGRADETIRQGVLKPCYLFSAGKGPRWIAPVAVEFRENHFERAQPAIDDRFSQPTAEALTWQKKRLKPEIEDIGRLGGRRILKVAYRYEELHTLNTICVLLAMETESGSGWFAPFYAISSEAFEGCFVSGKDVAFGYVATLRFSGTGGYRTHHLFDLMGGHPRLVRTVNSGRIWRPDFDSDAEFEKALKRPNDEESISRGELGEETPVGK